MNAREETRLLLARQLAQHNGQVWERLEPKYRERLLTFAGNLLATVERKAEVKWRRRDDR